MNNESSSFVLDSYAILAYLAGEQGGRRVKDVLVEATQGKFEVFHSIINLGEVLYITERELGVTSAHTALAAVEQLPIQVLPATNDIVLAAAHIKANFSIAYADAFAVVSAQDHRATILTGDREFENVSNLVRVEWLKE